MHVAAAGGFADVVKVLLKSSSINIHEQTEDGKTALDLACMALADRETEEDSAVLDLCHTVDALLSRGCKPEYFLDESAMVRAKEVVQRVAEEKRRDAQERKERDEARAESRKQMKRRREESDDTLRQVERELRTSVTEEEKKAEAYKECEKLAKKVVESRDVLQASLKGEGDKLPEYLSSKYYQIRIDVLRRKIQEKDQQIEEALKKMDFAEEDYLWFLRKKMRDLRLKYHPDKITDRTATEDDYKFYERLTKAYDVLCTKEERDKYLEMSNHVEWLQQRGEEEEARLVEKAIYDMETQKKAKTSEKKEEDPAQPPKEHVERAKKKLQERREEETWEKAGEKIKALTLGTPNKCKAPVVTSQRFSDRLEQCWVDIEWVCKCAFASAERIEYELRVQAIDKGAEDWAEVYHGWESSVSGLGPFPVGSYEFMVRARNSIGWGEWSDVIVVTLEDPKWEKQQRREAEQEAMREQAKTVQWEMQQILDEVQEMQAESKLTIHRASNLLFQLQAELKRARAVRQYLPKSQVLRDAEAAARVLEQWRDRKEAFSEWKQSLSEMKNHLFQEGETRRSDCDLSHFLDQDESYFCSLSPQIRNLIVQTLLGLDTKQVFKKLTPVQKEQIISTLKRAVDLGKAVLTEDSVQNGTLEAGKEKERSRTIFTKHQTEQLQRLADRFSGAQCRRPATPTSVRQESCPEDLLEQVVESPVASPMVSLPSPQTSGSFEPSSVVEERLALTPKDKSGEKKVRTIHVMGLPHREQVTRDDLVGALRPFAEVDGARVGSTDALVRFTSADAARSAISALEQGRVILRRCILNGQLAATDQLTEQALTRASGKPQVEKQPAVLSKPPQLAAPLQQVSAPAQHWQQQPQRQPPPPQQRQPQQQAPQRPQLQQPSQQLAPPRQPQQQVAPPSPQQRLETESLDSRSFDGDRLPRIEMSQLVSTDGTTAMFKCSLCNGVARSPKATMCCQKVFCGPCLDRCLQTTMVMPCCHASVAAEYDSTGGCNEQRVKKLDRNSAGVQAVLWRVYGNLRLRCANPGCMWTGDIFSYEDHCAVCSVGSEPSSGKKQPQGSRSQPPRSGQFTNKQPKASSSSSPQQSSESSEAVGGTYTVVWEHNATDSSQLSLKVGDRVCVEQVAAHGWVYGRLNVPGQSSKVGWFPSFCLPEQRPPPPQQSPPPMSPPSGSTQVTRDYEASDPAQLSVKKGEMVYVRQRDTSGWTFVVKGSTQGTGKREGWVPDWLLQRDA